MTITFEIKPEAVWDDGSPITWKDFDCTYRAYLKTPGSIGTTGYDQITSVKAGASDKEVVVSLKTVYAAYKNLFFSMIKAAGVKNCDDVSGDMQSIIPFSATNLKMQSWSPTQEVLVPNDKYWGADKATVKQVVMVPRPAETEIQALKAGEVDFIYPQFYAGITDALSDPNIKTSLANSGQYESMYMNAKPGRPFSDEAFREGFYKSIDLDAMFKQIYTPIVADAKLLTCGPMVPGPYCPSGIFGNKYDLAAAAKVLTAAGYAKNSDGMWAKDGKVPDIKWMVTAGNTRRENSQAYLIPLLAKAGFKVDADNCDSDCVFQQRQPSGDYDILTAIEVAPPDPGALIPLWASDEIPSAANGNAGQNFWWYDNAQATKDLHDSDHEIDPTKRAALIQDAIKQMDKDYIMIPLWQFPTSGAYRTDRVGNVDKQLANYMAFKDIGQWTDVDGDGKIVLGAEQWPGCLNPVTNCGNSSWAVWIGAHKVLPNAWDTTNDQGYSLGTMLVSEPKVVVAGG